MVIAVDDDNAESIRGSGNLPVTGCEQKLRRCSRTCKWLVVSPMVSPNEQLLWVVMKRSVVIDVESGSDGKCDIDVDDDGDIDADDDNAVIVKYSVEMLWIEGGGEGTEEMVDVAVDSSKQNGWLAGMMGQKRWWKIGWCRYCC